MRIKLSHCPLSLTISILSQSHYLISRENHEFFIVTCQHFDTALFCTL